MSNDTTTIPHAGEESSADCEHERVFLVIADESEELERALYYACRRAKKLSSRVALLHCKVDSTNQHFMQFLGIGERLEAESREQAEELMQNLSEKAYRWSGKMPIILIEQNIQESLPRLIKDENISSIIQPMPAENTPSNSPASYLLAGGAAQLHIPLTMIPATMTIEEINRLA